MTIYDKHYKSQNYFGKPYKQLIDFFANYQPKGVVLDLGCGQGRDSLAIAKLGYQVFAVDHSKVGINQLQQRSQGLNIQAVVADIYSYPITAEIDIVLLDSMLHFYKNDIAKECALVNRVLTELRSNALFCNCMIKGKSREKLLHSLVAKSEHSFKIVKEQYVDYPEFDSQFHMLVIKKI